MPVSEITTIPPILAEVVTLNPPAILELGIGFGKYGVLCREVLDAVHGRCSPRSWKHKIFGVEGFADYENPCWSVYNEVAIADFTKHYHKIKNWPLVLMVDSLEHVEKVEARAILHHLVTNNRHIIVSVPVGERPQDAVFGNEYERHRSTWNGPSEFMNYRYKVLHNGVCCAVSITGEGKPNGEQPNY